MSTAEENFDPQADVTQKAWPGNAEGTRSMTYPTMCRYIVEDGDLPEIKEQASEALERAGWPKTDRGKAEAILAYARERMHYVSDPPYRDTVYRPRYLLCTRGAKLCVKIGDCSNMNCALGALMRAAGFDVKVQDVNYGPGQQLHVNIVVCLPDERRAWVEADATVSTPLGAPTMGKKTVFDPHDPKVAGAGANAGAFIGAAAPKERAMLTGGYEEAIFGRGIGAGIVTPGDVLAYRVAWNQYVTDTVNAALDCATAFANTAAQQTDPEVRSNLQGQSQAIASQANSIIALWNTWHDQSDASIVVNGATILQSQQNVVLDAGSLRQQLTTGPVKCALTYANAQGQVVQAVSEPDPSLQAQIIARIEGLGILAGGILQIAVSTASNSLQVIGSAAKYAADKAAALGSFAVSPWTIAIAGLLLVGSVTTIAVVGARNADKIAAAAKSLRPV